MPYQSPPRRRPTPPRLAGAEVLEPRRHLAAGTFAFSAARYDVGEAVGSASFTIIRSGGADGAVDVGYTLVGPQFRLDRATAGEDFTDVSGIASFADGETEKTVAVPIVNDAAAEGNESVWVELTTLTGGATAATPDETEIYVRDDDSPGVLALNDEYAASEADGVATVTVHRGGTLQGTVTVDYHTSSGDSWGGYPQGFARPGLDFTHVSGTLTFADGQSAATITVPVLTDAEVEVTERLGVHISNPGGGAALATVSESSARVAIVDGEAGPNEPPSAANDTATTRTGQPALIDVLANDSDPEGGPLRIVVPTDFVPDKAAGPFHGTVSLDDGGTPADPADDRVRYVPASGFAGTDSFYYEIRDGFGGFDHGLVHLTVVGAGLGPDPEDPARTALFAWGTDGPDRITFQRRAGGRVAAFVNGVLEGVFAPTGRVAAIGLGGDDVIRGGSARMALRAEGGPGDDTIYGTRGPDALLGQEGNDRLEGGGGRDVLVGGPGADRLNGGDADDILVGGGTAYDGNYALGTMLPPDLFSAWGSTAEYGTRVEALRSHTGPLPPSNIRPDREADVLHGQDGRDVYLANTDGLSGIQAANDQLVRRRASETILEY